MADMQNYSLTAGSAAQVTVLDWIMAATLTEGAAMLSDFTGANAKHFHSAFATLPEAKQLDLLGQIAPQMLRMLAGLE